MPQNKPTVAIRARFIELQAEGDALAAKADAGTATPADTQRLLAIADEIQQISDQLDGVVQQN